MPQFNDLGKSKKPHPHLILDAPDPARLHFGACGSSESVEGEGGGDGAPPSPDPSAGQAPYEADDPNAKPGWFFGGVPFMEALWQIDLPPREIPRRAGETDFDYALIAVSDIIWELGQKYGPATGWPTRRELDFLYEIILACKRRRNATHI